MKPIVVNARFLTQKTTGTQRFASEISLELKKAYPAIIFVAPGNIQNKELAAALDVRVIGKLKGVLWEQIELPAYLFGMGSPLLLNFVNAAPLIYKNQVVTLHDVAFRKNPSWFSFGFRTFYNFLIPRILKNARKIITVSNFSKSEIISFFKIAESKIVVVPNAVGPFFKPVQAIKEQNDEAFILGVSSVEPRKNFTSLIQAFARIKNKGIKLYIVGSSGPAFAKMNLSQEVLDNTNLSFVGYVDDAQLLALYNKAKVFIYPSLYEGFGIPPLEAMACGCPTIVSTSSSIPEVCGLASIYFDPLNVNELAGKIDSLLDDTQLQQELSEKGINQAARYTWSASSRIILQLIDSL